MEDVILHCIPEFASQNISNTLWAFAVLEVPPSKV
jgi:hypothetical protein